MPVDVKATLARNSDTLATLAIFSLAMIVAALGSFFFIFSTELGGARVRVRRPARAGDPPARRHSPPPVSALQLTRPARARHCTPRHAPSRACSQAGAQLLFTRHVCVRHAGGCARAVAPARRRGRTRRNTAERVARPPATFSPADCSAVVAITATNLVIAAYVVNAFMEKPDPRPTSGVARPAARGPSRGTSKDE
jgi:hypothetical protein